MYKHVHIKQTDEFTCVIFFGRKAASITKTSKTSITPKPNRFYMRYECNNNRQSSHWLLAVIWFRIHFTGSGPFFAMAKQQKQIKKMMDIFFVLLVKREYLYECTRSRAFFLVEEMVFMCHIHTPRTPKMIPLYWRVDNTNHKSSNNSKNETFAHFYDELSSDWDEGKEEKQFHFFFRFGLVDIIL